MKQASAIRGPICGILAAWLFGMSAPLSKLLVSGAGTVALASVLYLSAGVVLWVVESGRPRSEAPLGQRDLPLLVAVTLSGGVIGPILMLYGLSQVSGVVGALLLNLEAPLTIVVALALFGEHLGRRGVLSAGLVVAGAALLAVDVGGFGGSRFGVLALAGACLAWAVDNNLTQRLSVRDPISVVRVKALGAGTGNLALAFLVGDQFPSGDRFLGAIVVGALSSGVSSVLDTYALRFVGAAREAAYFATAPFFGALLAVPVLGERFGPSELCAGGAMAVGVVLLWGERHSHGHDHASLTHEHAHVHDGHHQHVHERGTTAAGAHSHHHTHALLQHSHPHVSDAHHRHRH